MPSHVTVNLLPTWILEKTGGGRGKPGPRAAAWAGSTLLCFGRLNSCWAYSACTVFTSHCFQELLTLTSQGANYLQQVVMPPQWHSHPALSTHHSALITPRTLPVSRGLKWEDGDGQPCWQISASWNCLAGGFAELISPDLRTRWEKRKSCDAWRGLGLKGKPCSGWCSGVSQKRCCCAVWTDRQSTVVGPSGYFLYRL